MADEHLETLKSSVVDFQRKLVDNDVAMNSLKEQMASRKEEREDLERRKAELEERIADLEARRDWSGSEFSSPPSSRPRTPSPSPPVSPTAGPPVFRVLSPADENSDEVDEGGLPPRKRRRVECPPGQSGQEGERREEEQPAKKRHRKTGPWHPSGRVVDLDDVDFHVTQIDPRVSSFPPDLEAYRHVDTAGEEEEGAGPFMPEDPLQDGLPMQVDAGPVALVAPVPVVQVPVAPVLAAPAPGPMRVRRKVRPTPCVLPRRSCRLAARCRTDDRVYYVTRSGRSVRPPDRFTP